MAAGTKAGASFMSAAALQRKRTRDVALPSRTLIDDVDDCASPAASASNQGVDFEPGEAEYFFSLTEAQAAVRETFSFTVVAVGLKHHAIDAALQLEEGDAVSLRRDPFNEVDTNAIQVLAPSSDGDDTSQWRLAWEDATEKWSVERQEQPGIAIGFLAWQIAKELAPILDGGEARVLRAHVDQPARQPHELSLRIEVEAAGEAAEALRGAPELNGRKMIEVGERSRELAASDVTAALNAMHLHSEGASQCWPPSGAGTGLWQPLPTWLAEPDRQPQCDAVGYKEAPWPPFDVALMRRLSAGEVQAAQMGGWPPTDDVMVALGVGPARDRAWWAHFGLRPPIEWRMGGAANLLPLVRQSISANVSKAKVLLEGAAHAAEQPWLPSTLAALDGLMHEPQFWCRRKPDSYIRSFGGPYILGQDEGKLKLVKGSPHSELTAMVCQGHSLIYTLTHLTPPALPGFNTIIFGLNLRSAGFYYHQDSDLAGLPAKNAPLKPSQPVVTTVLYEDGGAVDGGKEVVLWRPVLNWDSGTRAYFGAAAGLLTTHGTVHVQRAGLQKGAKHGVFHTPGQAAREGWRVALSARITRADANARVDSFKTKGYYSMELGPEGQWTLPDWDAAGPA